MSCFAEKLAGLAAYIRGISRYRGSRTWRFSISSSVILNMIVTSDHVPRALGAQIMAPEGADSIQTAVIYWQAIDQNQPDQQVQRVA